MRAEILAVRTYMGHMKTYMGHMRTHMGHMRAEILAVSTNRPIQGKVTAGIFDTKVQ